MYDWSSIAAAVKPSLRWRRESYTPINPCMAQAFRKLRYLDATRFRIDSRKASLTPEETSLSLTATVKLLRDAEADISQVAVTVTEEIKRDASGLVASQST